MFQQDKFPSLYLHRFLISPRFHTVAYFFQWVFIHKINFFDSFIWLFYQFFFPIIHLFFPFVTHMIVIFISTSFSYDLFVFHMILWFAYFYFGLSFFNASYINVYMLTWDFFHVFFPFIYLHVVLLIFSAPLFRMSRGYLSSHLHAEKHPPHEVLLYSITIQEVAHKQILYIWCLSKIRRQFCFTDFQYAIQSFSMWDFRF